MGFWNDFGHVAKEAGKKVGKAADVATDTIIDKDAWGRTAAAIADGKGGKTIKGSDLLNMALDSTMLIPGVGLAGGAARVGVRTAGKLAAREATEAIAKKEAQTLLRSPLNNAIRNTIGSKTDDVAGKLVGKVISSGGGRRVAEEGAEKVAVTAGKRAAEREARGATSNQIKRMALKQEKGIGTKVGFGQTRKRILLNTALAGGANLGVRTYDELTGARPGPASKSKKKKDGGAATDAGTLAGLLGGNFTFTTAGGGEQTIKGQDLAALLASYADQNNTVEGSQVIHAR